MFEDLGITKQLEASNLANTTERFSHLSRAERLKQFLSVTKMEGEIPEGLLDSFCRLMDKQDEARKTMGELIIAHIVKTKKEQKTVEKIIGSVFERKWRRLFNKFFA